MDKKITMYELTQWLGDETTDAEKLVKTLHQVVNYEWPVNVMRKDIFDYAEGNEPEPKPFYAVMDNAGMYIQSGFNSQSKDEVKDSILEYIFPSWAGRPDFQTLQTLELEKIIETLGWTLDEDEHKFPDAFEIN